MLRARTIRQGTAVLALACLVPLTACGGGDEETAAPAKTSASPTADLLVAFKAGYAKVRVELNSVGDDLGKTFDGASEATDVDLARDLNTIAATFAEKLTALEALKPPPELAELFGKVTTASRLLESDLKEVIAAVDANSGTEAEAASTKLATDGEALDTLTTELNKKLGITEEPESPSPSESASAAGGKISVTYAEPADEDEAFAKEILQLGGTDGVADGLSTSFKLPTDLTISVVNGMVGPQYSPADKTITLSYGFVNFTAETLKANFPDLQTNDEEFGKSLAAVDGFILLHEFGHALIDVYELPVLGKEEDAADSVATVFLTETVDNGAEYAFDAARFFKALSARQRELTPADFFDEHSLDEQRATSIVCWIGGSNQENLAAVEETGILSQERLARCPSEYQQKVKAWKSLLAPYARG